ncbi:Tyrosine--tRNA ligase [Neolecta irregularis DAH-3]|uniref:Tyrosine--tRNA ligase n=1 Tax=Neolecta irregularis (strain DAH-3) TaxID=1198029 RepID=A0A1U7LR37_NEOID|nr:Tyrosine--tRNA ligase [Neolecta irregularis DAH-3]|eukprot:OLL25043.1 Tyrosine--tRNA ligase [Neolecta irregularis DAH-3]
MRLYGRLLIHVHPPPLLQDLAQRGLLVQIAGAAPPNTENFRIYAGADPTAPSLHIGNLVALVPLLHSLVRGNSPTALIGTATVQLGDPSGRNTERSILAQHQQLANAKRIESQLHKFFENGSHYAQHYGYHSNNFAAPEIRTNAEWLNNLSFLDFMATIGRNARVSQMIARESVKARLQSDQGLSFAEFSYQLVQAFDFWTLYSKHKVICQVGGNDQWGNISAGIDLIHRLSQVSPSNMPNVKPFGFTVPLLTNSAGQKLGKSVGNSLWLDPQMTSPFDFYQECHFVAIGTNPYSSSFVLLPLSYISHLTERHHNSPEERLAQKSLAKEVTALVHGREILKRVEKATSILFSGNESLENSPETTSEDLLDAFKDDERLVRIHRGEILSKSVSSIMKENQLAPSKSQAEQLIANGGIHINNQMITDVRAVISQQMIDGQKLLILRYGKNKFLILYLI